MKTKVLVALLSTAAMFIFAYTPNHYTPVVYMQGATPTPTPRNFFGCISVFHRMRDGSANVRAPKANGTSYKAEFRTISRSFPAVMSGPTPGVEILQTHCGFNTGNHATVWRYRTTSLNPATVGAVEWTITATDHQATICNTQSAVVSIRTSGGAPQVLRMRGTISGSSSCGNPLSPFGASVSVLYKSSGP